MKCLFADVWVPSIGMLANNVQENKDNSLSDWHTKESRQTQGRTVKWEMKIQRLKMPSDED